MQFYIKKMQSEEEHTFCFNSAVHVLVWRECKLPSFCLQVILLTSWVTLLSQHLTVQTGRISLDYKDDFGELRLPKWYKAKRPYFYIGHTNAHGLQQEKTNCFAVY